MAVKIFTFFIFILQSSLAFAASEEQRCSLWVDLYMGEPVSLEEIVEDLVEVDVIYLGEAHRLNRHHQLQLQIVQALNAKGKRVLLGLEQMEHIYQPILERYNQGAIDFDELAKSTEWAKNWANYQDYREIVEAVREQKGTIIALNAPADVIRKIGRGGMNTLSEKERKSLPLEMQFDDPLYERLMNQLLMVHMPLTEEILKPVFHAQVSRDETMADRLAQAWRSLERSEDWVAVVLCGAGHCSYGLGIPDRFKRLVPESNERIVLMSESGDTEMTASEKAMMREIKITHEMLRFLQRPIADYLHATGRKDEAEE